MAPAPLPLMIVRLGLRPTLRTQPIPHFLVLQVNVNLSFPQIQVHAFHIPRGFDPQNSSIQFAVLHAENCRMVPLKSRNSRFIKGGEEGMFVLLVKKWGIESALALAKRDRMGCGPLIRRLRRAGILPQSPERWKLITRRAEAFLRESKRGQ